MRVLGAIGVMQVTQAVDLGIIQKMFVAEGIWVRPFGKLVYAMPPYVMGSADVATLTAAMVDVVAQL